MAATASELRLIAMGGAVPVLSVGRTAPPSAPASGDRHLMASAGLSGDWSAFTPSTIARYDGSAWRNDGGASRGNRVLDTVRGRLWGYTGSAWTELYRIADSALLTITPAAVAAQANNYAGADGTDSHNTWADADIVRISLTGNQLMTGAAAPADVTRARKILINVDASSDVLTLAAEHASSDAANRFTHAASIAPGAALALQYDFASSRWRPLESVRGAYLLVADDITVTGSGNLSRVLGATHYSATMIGGGGAGGGCPSGSNWGAAGAGGGAGQLVEVPLTAWGGGTQLAFAIGAGGTGASGADGGDGGNTTLGAFTALGGEGGGAGVQASAQNAIQGGRGGGNDSAAAGGPGLLIGDDTPVGGNGGASLFGGTSGETTNSANGVSALSTAYGAGGAGAIDQGSENARTGGNGAGGYIRLQQWIAL